MSYSAVDTVLWINFDQKMYVVGHDFHFNYFGVYLGGFLCDELLQTLRYISDEDFTPILGTPDNVVFT